jgi:hypothetical protein
VWLFIRTRDKCKGAVAQYISQVISDQKKQKNNKETTEFKKGNWYFDRAGWWNLDVDYLTPLKNFLSSHLK